MFAKKWNVIIIYYNNIKQLRNWLTHHITFPDVTAIKILTIPPIRS